MRARLPAAASAGTRAACLRLRPLGALHAASAHGREHDRLGQLGWGKSALSKAYPWRQRVFGRIGEFIDPKGALRYHNAALIPQAQNLLLREREERKKRVLLICDEAHLLTSEQLEDCGCSPKPRWTP